jgi:hypothetical protein
MSDKPTFRHNHWLIFEVREDLPTHESLRRPGGRITPNAMVHESGIQYGYPSGYKLDLRDRLRFSYEAGQ